MTFSRTLRTIVYFLLIVPPLIFFTDLTRNPYVFQIVLLNSVTLLWWMIWLYGGIKDRRLAIPRTPLDLPLWSFFVVITISWLGMLYMNMHEPYLSFGIASEGFKRWLFILVNAVLVYYCAVVFVSDENRDRVTLVLLWTGWIAAAYGVLQYFGIEPIWPKVLNPFGGRCVSTFGNPNFLSSYLVVLFPVAFAGFVRSTGGRQKMYLLFSATYFAALLCTLTRSSWLGVLVALGMLLAMLWKFERLLIKTKAGMIAVCLGVFLAVGIFWPKSAIEGYNPSILERLTETSQATKTYYGSWHQRRLIWSCAWHMVRENPVLGKGWGCFELFYPFYQGRHLFLEPYRTFRTHANNSHNEILEIWSQTGTLGMGVYLWLLVTVFTTWWFLATVLTGEKRILAIAFGASLAGMLTDNMLNVSLQFAIPGFIYWWSMGMMVGLARSEKRELSLKPVYVRLLAVVLIIVAGLFIIRYVRTFLGEVYYFRGFKASKLNNVQAAIPSLEAAHRFQRFEVNNNYELANCYARVGDRDKALEMYKESLRANAGYDEIYFNMATVLGQAGRREEAIEEYTRSLYINPLSLEGYSALGSFFLQDPPRYAAAGIKLFEQCVAIYPQSRDIWNNLGFLYTKVNRDADAAAAYRRAVEIDPDFELARKNLHITLKKMGKTDTSLEEAEQLTQTVERQIAAQQWPAALTNCERLITLAPNSFKARLYLANLYFTTGKLQEAITHYKTALTMQPRHPSVMGNLGLVYFEAKQYGDARVMLEELLKVDPQNQIARQKLEAIYQMPQKR